MECSDQPTTPGSVAKATAPPTTSTGSTHVAAHQLDWLVPTALLAAIDEDDGDAVVTPAEGASVSEVAEGGGDDVDCGTVVGVADSWSAGDGVVVGVTEDKATAVGGGVETAVGRPDGIEVGDVEGGADGEIVSVGDGAMDGRVVGSTVGARVGDTVGAIVGKAVGDIEGATEGNRVGTVVGDVVGDAVGDAEGNAVGDTVGDTVGAVYTA